MDNEANKIDQEDLEAAADKYDEMTKLLYLIIEGYIHPIDGGDDEYFIRGFRIKAQQLDRFKQWFKKDYEKKSAPMNDYHIKEVTQQEWEIYFHL